MKGGGGEECIQLVPELFFEQDTSGMAQEDQNCSLSHTLRKRFFYSFYHSSNSLKMHYYPHPRHLLSPLPLISPLPLNSSLTSHLVSSPLTLFLTYVVDEPSELPPSQCQERHLSMHGTSCCRTVTGLHFLPNYFQLHPPLPPFPSLLSSLSPLLYLGR